MCIRHHNNEIGRINTEIYDKNNNDNDDDDGDTRAASGWGGGWERVEDSLREIIRRKLFSKPSCSVP